MGSPQGDLQGTAGIAPVSTEAVTALQRFLPFLAWLPSRTRENARADIEAGVVGAILILPQAIALATLAGMPPEYGIYTSIIPVLITALWGSSWHTLSGPNTAVCVLVAAAVAPFASIGTSDYIGYALALTFMAGLIQFAIGTLRAGIILDFISHTVITAIVVAVAFFMIVSAAAPFMGVLFNLDEPFFVRLYQLVHDAPRANGYAVAVGICTVAAGLIMRRYWRRYALVVAVVAGSLFGSLLNALMGPAVTELELLGNLSLSALPLSAPRFDTESMYVLKELITSAFAIAFLGLIQTVVIARSLAAKSGQLIDTNQEITAQGLSNLVGPFFSCFASSGSFNRSAAHYEAGAKTPLAAVYASLILAVLVLVGAGVIAYLPMAAVAGALVLVGYGLIDMREIREVLRSRQEGIIYGITLLTALSFGLNAGVFTGLLLSLVIYMWYAAGPNVRVEEYVARNGRLVCAVTIDGNLFFGSVRNVEKQLAALEPGDDDDVVLLLRTDHLTYLDVPGAKLIDQLVRRRRDLGGDAYVYVADPSVERILHTAGMSDPGLEGRVIHKGLDHPMKHVLYPYGHTTAHSRRLLEEEPTMEALAKRLRATRLLGPLSTEQLIQLLENTPLRTAPSGDIIIRPEQPLNEHLILIEGELELQRVWLTPGDEHAKSYTWILRPTTDDGKFGFLGAADQRVRARALTDVRYLLVDADAVDELWGWNQHFKDVADMDGELRRRMDLVKQVSVFQQLPYENVRTAFERMTPMYVQDGQTIVTQSEIGDRYYVIEEGEAEVERTDPFTDETQKVAVLGPGDAFGEEALLQEGYRNATVTMTTPGKLLVLEKKDFDELIKPGMVDEIDAEAAQTRLQSGEAKLLDCRYDMEYNESRIPGATFVPLDTLRRGVHDTDPDASYVVYCRSGRRSKAAAFLLRERNIKAVSLKGGIKEWPYEVDTTPVILEQA